MKRIALMSAVACAVVAGSFVPAHADPYRWCADYRVRGGATNCYFRTFEQCQAAISGVGGFCRVNGFYDGRPVRTPEDGYAYQPRPKKSHVKARKSQRSGGYPVIDVTR